MQPQYLQQYLAKIGITSQPDNSLQSLKRIHQAQHRRIPFENFTIALGLPVELDQQSLFNKLVLNHRGGYCFEVNALLEQALKSLGFSTKVQLARVHLDGQTTARTHQVTLVTIDAQDWLVDAGFGSRTPRAPLPVTTGEQFNIDYQTFRFIEDEQYGLMLQAKEQQEWNNLYSLDFTHVCPRDIECGNFYTSSSPNSIFLSNRTACLPTEQGIVTLLNYTLTIRQGDQIEQIELNDDESYLAALQQYFAIELNAQYQQLMPINSDK